MRRPPTLRDPLVEFIEWVDKNIEGYEKGEAQIFLDRMFKALGHEGAKEAGGKFEDGLKRQRGRRSSTSFIDFIWQPRVLIEMKSRGEKLERHINQAIEYWWDLAPNRPEWVILCNFDEFWIYNFNKEVQEPLARVKLENFAKQSEAFAFLLPEPKEPLFDPNRLEVTEQAATMVAQVFKSMVKRKIDREIAQRFTLQCVMALFSEDLGLLPKSHFTRILKESLEAKNPGQRAEELIGALFHQMNSRRAASPGSRNEKVQYFNGGLFATVNPVVLTRNELEYLNDAAKHEWSNVNPAIFGTLFQQSMDTKERHRHGAHFTTESDILKVVNPTIVRPWKDRIAKAQKLSELIKVREDLLKYQVLDPACGSGNFLYVAFRELKRLELELLLAIREEYKGSKAKAAIRSYLSVKQFHGFDVLDFAVELTKVTLLLGKEIALAETLKVLNEEQGTFEFDNALPLEDLNFNIRKADALFAEWPKVDAIIGNPPFQSKNKAQKEMGRGYLGQLRSSFNVPGRADYCVFFFRKAHAELKPGCRAGLVGTNTIRQNESRVGGLDHIVQNGGTITEAWSTQPWSGDATVYVSVVNWIKGEDVGPKKLWFEEENQEPRSVVVDKINSALSEGIDVSQAMKLHACSRPEYCAQGQTHGHEGFLMKRAESLGCIKAHPEWNSVLVPFLIGDDLIGTVDQKPTRYAIDFSPRDIFEASQFGELFQRVKVSVLPKRKASAEEEAIENKKALEENSSARVNWHHKQFLERWWLFSYPREALLAQLTKRGRYIACVRVTKRPIFEFVSSEIHPNDALQVFPFDDDYSFGILQSNIHWRWFTARCSTLKADPRYTSNTVFDTFPWPQTPTVRDVQKVAKAGVELRKLRRSLLRMHEWTLRDLYRSAEQDGSNSMKDAQAALDDAVADAYAMKARERQSPLAFILRLNFALSDLEKSGTKIVGPGLPPCAKEVKDFITDDCVQP